VQLYPGISCADSLASRSSAGQLLAQFDQARWYLTIPASLEIVSASGRFGGRPPRMAAAVAVRLGRALEAAFFWFVFSCCTVPTKAVIPRLGETAQKDRNHPFEGVGMEQGKLLRHKNRKNLTTPKPESASPRAGRRGDWI
jgi:hypothetical protein